MKTDVKSHLILLEGAHNVRDLGGYPTKDGRTTKKGVFFRADSMANLTAGDVAKLRKLGVTLAVDLRSPEEILKKPSRLAGVDGIRYEKVPMIDDITTEDLQGDHPMPIRELYEKNIDRSQAAFGKAFRLFLENREGASLFHCTAGKDRTGMLAMLLLELAEVPEEIIVDDYAATEDFMRDVFEQMSEEMLRMGMKVPESTKHSAPENIEAAMDHVRKKYGGGREYLALGGISSAELDELAGRFIE